MFYSNRMVRGYNAPVEVHITRRGRGKTFGEVREALENAILDKTKRFIYVVENLEMAKKLSQNQGERFFSAIIQFYKDFPSRKNNQMLNTLMTGAKISDGSEDITVTKSWKIEAGTIYVGGDFVGYIVALSDFANLKRNNFVGFTRIIVDEFIPEKIDMNNYDNPRKLASIVQSIGRLKDMKIILLGNAVTRRCPVLDALGLQDIKLGEVRKIFDEYGLFLVAYMEDPATIGEFKDKADASVSGRLSRLLKEDNLEKNEFGGEGVKIIPNKRENSRLRYVLKLEEGDFRVNVTDSANFYILKAGVGGVTNRQPLWVNNYKCQWRGNVKPLFIEKALQGKMYFDTPSTATIVYKSLGLIT